MPQDPEQHFLVANQRMALELPRFSGQVFAVGKPQRDDWAMRLAISRFPQPAEAAVPRWPTPDSGRRLCYAGRSRSSI